MFLSCIKAGASGYIPKRALGSELVSAIYAVNQGDSFLYPSAAHALVDFLQKPSGEDLYDRLTDREREGTETHRRRTHQPTDCQRPFPESENRSGHRAKIMEKLDIHNHTQL